MNARTTHRAAVDRLTKELVDQGKLIEAGFAAMIHDTYNVQQLPPTQLRDLRMAFFGGAQHLFGSLTGSILDAGDEPTDADMRRISLIAAELDTFISEFARDHMPTKGQA